MVGVLSVPMRARTHFCHVLAHVVVLCDYVRMTKTFRTVPRLYWSPGETTSSNRSVHHPDEPKMAYSREQTAITVKYDFRTVSKVNRLQRTPHSTLTHRRIGITNPLFPLHISGSAQSIFNQGNMIHRCRTKPTSRILALSAVCCVFMFQVACSRTLEAEQTQELITGHSRALLWTSSCACSYATCASDEYRSDSTYCNSCCSSFGGTCDLSFHKTSFTTTCASCHSSCATCSGSGSGSCATCPSGRYFYDGILGDYCYVCTQDSHCPGGTECSTGLSGSYTCVAPSTDAWWCSDRADDYWEFDIDSGTRGSLGFSQFYQLTFRGNTCSYAWASDEMELRLQGNPTTETLLVSFSYGEFQNIPLGTFTPVQLDSGACVQIPALGFGFSGFGAGLYMCLSIENFDITDTTMNGDLKLQLTAKVGMPGLNYEFDLLSHDLVSFDIDESSNDIDLTSLPTQAPTASQTAACPSICSSLSVGNNMCLSSESLSCAACNLDVCIEYLADREILTVSQGSSGESGESGDSSTEASSTGPGIQSFIRSSALAAGAALLL